ncbi:MAG: hypothetical protein LHV68_12870 [Elusimicrobia bacterium]|nr:hypothetical protein [Candidatus Liberimonas magnetica]
MNINIYNTKWLRRLFLVLIGIIAGFVLLWGLVSQRRLNRGIFYNVEKVQYINTSKITKEGLAREEEKIVNGKRIYKYVYLEDKFERRITPVDNPDKRDTAFLFFADSYMLGQGVKDNETLPFYLSQLVPNCKPYNYGCPGYGPHNMLSRLEGKGIVNEIDKSKKYVCIYLFIPAHINRVIGSVSSRKRVPYYYINKKGILERDGDFVSGRPLLTQAYEILGGSKFGRFILNGHDFPKINESHIRLTCRIIEESRNCFKEKFGSDDFIVLFWPDSGPGYMSKLIPYLKAAGVKYLDYHGLEDFYKEGYKIPHDNHPNKLAYEQMAKTVSKDLEAILKN